MQNIDLIDNLVATVDKVIRSKKGKLKEISVSQVNEALYDQKCRDNPLSRDIQRDLEQWKNNWNDYVLYLTGARQIGKTTELLKFAYKNYEQIIYVNLANEDTLHKFEELVIANSLRFGMVKYCREARPEEYADTPKTILIINEIQSCKQGYQAMPRSDKNNYAEIYRGISILF